MHIVLVTPKGCHVGRRLLRKCRAKMCMLMLYSSSMWHSLAGPLLSVSVEKSPLDKSVDLRVYVNALPVKIIYEAVS